MTLKQLTLIIEGMGGTVRDYLFDAGHTVTVDVRIGGRAYIYRFSDEWGDTGPDAVARIVSAFAEHGIILGEDDPTIQHEGVYIS